MNAKLTKAVACLAVSPLLWQCSTEDDLLPDSSDSPLKTVTVTVSGGGDIFADPLTRTSLGSAGQVFWSEGDKVFINGNQYSVVPDPSDPSTGTVKNVPESDEYVAYYAESGTYWHGDDSISIYLSSYQDYAGTLALNSNPMVAYSTTPELSFRNVCGILRLGITGNGQAVRKVLFMPDGGTGVSGTLNIALDDIRNGLKDSYADFHYVQSYSKLIEIYPEDGISVTLDSEPEYFHFILPSQTYSGFTVMVEDGEGNIGVQRMNKPVVLKRSALVPMETFAFEPLPVPEITVNSTASGSVSYTVKAAPGMPVVSAVVYAPLYDKFPEDINEEPSQYGYAISAMSDSDLISISENGIHEFTASDVCGINTSHVPMEAGMDYYIVAAYYADDEIMGFFPVKGFSTTPASGPGPDLEISPADVTYSNARINVRTGANAALLAVCMMSEFEYQSYMSAYGMNDKEILLAMGDVLDSGDLAAAQGSGYLYEPWTSIYPSTDYVVLARAVSDTGGETIEKLEIRTPEHFPKDAAWETVQEDGIEFRFFWWTDDSSTQYDINLQGGILQKMAGREIYRVSCDFSQEEFASYMESFGCSHDAASGESWVYIDAENTDASSGQNYLELYPAESYIGYDSPSGERLYIAIADDIWGYITDYGDRISFMLNYFNITSDILDYDKYVTSLSVEISVYNPVME